MAEKGTRSVGGTNTRNIPRDAEKLFDLLCSRAGATCNPSKEDVRGWDFFVQFPLRPISGLPLDLNSPAEKCLVQVKTNSGKKRGATLKLSNALEAAIADTPFFVVLFVYGKKVEPEKICILHFWEAEIARTLKAVRELDSVGKSDLNRHEITFAIGDMVHVATDGLLAAIEAMIVQQGALYSEVKRQIARSVGFQDAAIEGHFTFKNGVTLDQLIDLHIGRIDSVDIIHFSAHSIRFGIPAKTPFQMVAEGKASLRVHPKPCILVLSSETAGREISLPSQIYAPAIPNLPAEKIRLRVTNSYVDLVADPSPEKTSFETHWDGGALVGAEEVSTTLDLMYILSGGDVHFRILMEGQEIAKGAGSVESSTIPDQIAAIDNFIKIVLSNTKTHDRPDSWKLSVAELLDRWEGILDFNRFVSLPSVKGSFEIEWADQPYSGPVRIFYPVLIELPSHSVYCIVKRKLALNSTSGDTASFEMGAIDYKRLRVVNGVGEEIYQLIRQEIEAKIGSTPDEITITMSEPIRAR